MPTIGLDKLYYAEITEGENGIEEYGPPSVLAKAIKADLSVDLAEAILYADDAAAYVALEFKSGKLSLGMDDLGRDASGKLLGARTDENGVLISTTEDASQPVAIGFRARKANGKYRYFWLYRVKFGVPSTKDNIFLRKQFRTSHQAGTSPTNRQCSLITCHSEESLDSSHRKMFALEELSLMEPRYLLLSVF